MKKFFAAILNHSEYIIILVLIGGAIYLGLSFGGFVEPTSEHKDPKYYANSLFDQSYVHKIEIEITEERLSELLASPGEKTKFPANVIIDGEKVSEVAFSTRGNISLYSIAEEGNSTRYSFKINFQKFNNSQEFHGLDKLILNNLYADSSYMRDFLAFELMRAAGVAAPLSTFTEVYINGELKGLYLAVEDVDDSFLDRNSFSKDAALYKPEATAHDHYVIYKMQEQLPRGRELKLVVDSGDSEFDFEGSDLVYKGNDYSDYKAIFNNVVSKISNKDKEYVLASLKSLAPTELEDPIDYWDIDALVKYLAVNSFVISTDSYTGETAHNYYLLTSKGKNTLLPWDYNLAFQGLWLNPEVVVDENYINWPIDALLSSSDTISRPLWDLIVENPEYLKKYHNELQNLIDNYILNGECHKKIDEIVDLIRPYVYSDPTRFYTIDEFESGVVALREFMFVRTDSVQKQLWGLLPTSFKKTKTSSKKTK